MPDPKPLHVDLIAHCDWSKSANKRWMTTAILRVDGAFIANGPERVDNPPELVSSLRARVSPQAAILLGFDFPIGLPISYTSSVWKGDFLSLLPLLGEEEPWQHFYEIARTRQEIAPHRPFYPHCPGGTRHKHLLDALESSCLDDLRRRCDLGYEGRRAACPIFWTLGAQQVGRAAISGWREVLAPALQQDPDHFFVWPFSGSLRERLQPGSVVVAETYPAEYYRHLGVRFVSGRGGKCVQNARRANAAALMGAATSLRVHPSAQLQEAIENGFPPEIGGDDAFDALVGLLGMIKVVRGELPAVAPDDDAIRRVEGWMLGQSEEPCLCR